MEFISKLFDTSDFPQRWNCGNWTDFHGWIHIVSDLAVFGAYTAIPCVIYFFAKRRKDLQFPGLFWLFCAFIFACGTVHFIEAMLFWTPIYRVSAVFKCLTAIASWATVFALIKVAPEALKLPTLSSLNSKLEGETKTLRQTQLELTDALQEIKKSKQLTDAILASIGSGVIVANKEGKLVLVNDAAQSIVDLEFIQKGAKEWTQQVGAFKEDGTTLISEEESPLALAISGEKVVGQELLIRNKGETWIRINGTPVRDQDQNLLGGVVVFDDVTKLRELQNETQAQLSTANETLDRVLNSIDDVVWSGQYANGQLEFVYFSPAVKNIVGMEPSELIGRHATWVSLIHPDDRKTISEKITLIMEANREISTFAEYRVLHTDGSVRWIRNRLRTEAVGENFAVHGVISDISTEKKTKEALVQAERLASIGTLAAGIAHEINNPLGAMMLTTELAIRQVKKGNYNDAEIAATLGNVTEQIDRCSRIVSGVLQFARNQQSSREPVDLGTVAKKARDLILFRAEKKGIEISLDDRISARVVEVNETELEQVFVNLFVNAIEASPMDSKIKVLIEESGENAIVSIHDEGGGMDESTKKNAFDPFFTSRRESGGTGLGLSMCHTIISSHGGTIEIEDSTILNGASVTFQIPLSLQDLGQDAKV